MPYVDKKIRDTLSPTIDRLAGNIAALSGGTLETEAGTLNYAITRLILQLFPRRAQYWQYALIKGVLDDVKDEFYRRRTTPYEESKKAEKGDVYE